MTEEQGALISAFPSFRASLSMATGALPNLHLGVVSTDLGTGVFSGSEGCTDHDGALQATARGACAPPSGNFISDVSDVNGGRLVNYSGTLDDTFACIAPLGTNGCGFPQPMAAVTRALANPANGGFLRANAHLAVIVLSDGDDC